MAKSKKSSPSNTDLRARNSALAKHRHRGLSQRMKLPANSYRDHFDLVEPHINAEGVHTWAFDPPCPVDVLFLTVDDRHRVRMNRHGYFEVLFLCSGSANCHIQDRLLPFNEGDHSGHHHLRARHCGPRGIARHSSPSRREMA